MNRPRAIESALAVCEVCGRVEHLAQAHSVRCARCGSPVHARKPNSLNRTWALLMAAMLAYVPANILPIMKTSLFGRVTEDTIVSGVVYFLQHGDWPLALIIFAASVIVPLFKMLALAYLLISVHRGSVDQRQRRTELYRLTEFLGRWSMVDVFVVALMAALVHVGTIVSIVPGYGVVAFAAVVILTMLASRSFDPRLIWDVAES